MIKIDVTCGRMVVLSNGEVVLLQPVSLTGDLEAATAEANRVVGCVGDLVREATRLAWVHAVADRTAGFTR